MADSGFTFLTVDGQGRPLEPGSRSTIRSRCMIGVNVRQDSRRSKRRTQKTAGTTKPSTQGSSRELVIAERFDKTGTIAASRVQGTTTCSPPSGSLQLRSMHFSLDLPYMSSSTLFTVMKYNDLLTTVYPLEPYLAFPEDQGQRMSDYLKLLGDNQVLLNSVFFATYAVDDICGGKQLSHKTQLLLSSVLSSLNQKLHQVATQRSHSTFLIILILLFGAEAFHDYDAVATHLDGLRKLFQLCEQPTSVDPRLLFKIQQFDLRYALATGRPLYFPLEFFDPKSVPDVFFDLPLGSSDILGLLATCPSLLECYQSLQILAHDINQFKVSGTYLSWNDFQTRVSTTQTQLINLGKGHIPEVGEALRLGLLAFISTLSRSPVQKPHLPNFITRLQMNYMLLQRRGESYRGLTIWLLLMGFLSTVEVSNTIARCAWADVVSFDMSWRTARLMMGSLPWIKSIHDELGKQVFKGMQSGKHSRGLAKVL